MQRAPLEHVSRNLESCYFPGTTSPDGNKLGKAGRLIDDCQIQGDVGFKLSRQCSRVVRLLHFKAVALHVK
jgi:hypothetical protein